MAEWWTFPELFPDKVVIVFALEVLELKHLKIQLKIRETFKSAKLEGKNIYPASLTFEMIPEASAKGTSRTGRFEFGCRRM